MNCPNCNKEVSPDWNVCPHCGYKPKKCSNPSCNAGWLPQEARFCPVCGRKINAEEEREKAEEQRIAEEARKKAELQRRMAEEKKRQEEEARRKAEEETKRKEEERKKAEEQRIIEEVRKKAELQRRMAEEKKRQEEEARRKAEEEARRKEEERKKAEAKRIAEEERQKAELQRRMAEEKKRQEEEARRKAEEEAKRMAEARRMAEERRRQLLEDLRKAEERKRKKREDVFLSIIIIVFAPIWWPILFVKDHWKEIGETILGLMGLLIIVALLVCFFAEINPIKVLSNPKKMLSKPAPLTTNVVKKENGDMEIFIGDVSFLMKYVEGGTFTMGCTPEQGDDCEDCEFPAHQVTVSSFYMCETEVTQALWKLVLEDTRWKKLKGKNPSHFVNDMHPVDYVNWVHCVGFIQKLNEVTGLKFRLPTEAEWEYAARGGNRSQGYKYCGSNSINDVAWYDDNSNNTTHPVKTKKANEIGLYDMSGNVYEWCSDLFRKKYYEESPSTNPKGPESGEYANDHVLRGGGWRNTPTVCRVSSRFGFTNHPDETFGFRLALDQ